MDPSKMTDEQIRQAYAAAQQQVAAQQQFFHQFHTLNQFASVPFGSSLLDDNGNEEERPTLRINDDYVVTADHISSASANLTVWWHEIVPGSFDAEDGATEVDFDLKASDDRPETDGWLSLPDEGVAVATAARLNALSKMNWVDRDDAIAKETK